MKKKKGRYSNEFKQEVLRMAETSEKPISELERDLGLSAGLVRKWMQRYRIDEHDQELARSESNESEAEIRRLKRELEIVKQERDILKKAIQVFSREQKLWNLLLLSNTAKNFQCKQCVKCWMCPAVATMRFAIVNQVPEARKSSVYLCIFEPLTVRVVRPMVLVASIMNSKHRAAQGVHVGRHRIGRLMRQADLKVKSRRPYKVTTKRDPRLPVVKNLLNRDFEVAQPDRKWVADFTYIATEQGWLYLATVMDLFSLKIVGWSMQPRMTKALVKDALQMALMRRCPDAGLLHHSDQGSQYASFDYQKVLFEHKIQVSMSRTGNCYDNSVMESFFATLKTECVLRRYSSRDEARRCLFDYIEVWYNRSRRHSSLDYLSPDDYERLYYRDNLSLH